VITFAAVQSLKKTNLSLRCEFTPEELAAKAEALANAAVELQELREQKRNVVAEFGELIKEVEGRARALSKAYRLKGENRFVECAVLLDTPERGKKTIVRMDLNQTVRVENMTDDDRQDELPLAEHVQRTEEPTGEESGVSQ
jgi:restriction endonuclease Mrr